MGDDLGDDWWTHDGDSGNLIFSVLFVFSLVTYGPERVGVIWQAANKNKNSVGYY